LDPDILADLSPELLQGVDKQDHIARVAWCHVNECDPETFGNPVELSGTDQLQPLDGRGDQWHQVPEDLALLGRVAARVVMDYIRGLIKLHIDLDDVLIEPPRIIKPVLAPSDQ